MAPLSGWKRTAVYLAGLVATLTALLVAMLLVSLFALDKYADDDSIRSSVRYGGGDTLGQSIIYKGDCNITSRANLWIHLVINIIGTGVLASSNFFMQSLVAPTRNEVDAAHKSGHWLEIGVQSLKNIRFLGWNKVLFWFLFSLSSVPLHLVFNGCVLESKGSNGFTMVLGAESLVHGAWKGERPLARGWRDAQYPPELDRPYGEVDYTAKAIIESIATNRIHGRYKRITFSECMERYNDPLKSLTHWRHLIMVMYNYGDERHNASKGWKLSQVYKNTTGMQHIDIVNPLWVVSGYKRTRSYNWGITRSRNHMFMKGLEGASTTLDPTNGMLVLDPEIFKAEYRVMKVDHCWSEKYAASCRLSIANSLLLIVCILCGLKCILCLSVLRLRVWGDENPLMTPGDAIASFISKPDEETKGMCTLSLEDFGSSPVVTELRPSASTQGYRWLQGPRQWHTISRKWGKAVPRNIWILSYLLIGSSLIVGATMMGISLREQEMGEASFSHSPFNQDVDTASLLFDPTLLPLTMLANTPQLILSVCYLAYNGLFTRMLAELEWSKYSIKFRALRVTDPSGSQKATYRLQLPYRFSLPLMIVSTTLHWLYSNCIYVSNYEAYSPDFPYRIHEATLGLQFSSKAIVISFVITVCVAVAPIFLANVRLPGITVITGGNSAVISAACHYPSQKLTSLNHATTKPNHSVGEHDSVSTRLIGAVEMEELEDVARGKVKWGRLSVGRSDESQVGHLGFGLENQNVDKPVEGEHYSGF